MKFVEVLLQSVGAHASSRRPTPVHIRCGRRHEESLCSGGNDHVQGRCSGKIRTWYPQMWLKLTWYRSWLYFYSTASAAHSSKSTRQATNPLTVDVTAGEAVLVDVPKMLVRVVVVVLPFCYQELLHTRLMPSYVRAVVFGARNAEQKVAPPLPRQVESAWPLVPHAVPAFC